MRRFPALAFPCERDHGSPSTQSCGGVLDRPDQFAKKWSRHLPHPRCPAARSFDWSSLGLPHPDSPAARYVEWSAGVLLHPNSPAGRGYRWDTGGKGIDHSADADLTRSRLAVQASLDRHSESLRETLPDAGLQVIYDRQMGLLKEAYGFMMSLSIDRKSVV